ncbi:MAG: DUF3313 domain-containing protein [Proteobacteria bacterium]|nr:DUF3313 domain-containing protein [Pseudomonadota bacterium]
MITKSISAVASALCILALLSSGAVVAAEPQYSGFIENYPDLKSDPRNPGAMIWEKPGLDRSAYSAVMIETIDIFIHPQSKYKGIDANDMKAISDAFYKDIVDVLEPDIPVVSKPGPGVLVVRLAITNVHLKKKKRGLLGYTPVGLVVTGMQDLAGKRVRLMDATLEGESFDGQTGERLAVVVDTQADLPGKKGEKPSWDQIAKTLRSYAERFRSEALKR